MNESNGVIRDARKLGIPKMLILGLQHMFAMFGATILVPILVNSYFVDACGEGPSRGLTVSVTLFCAGFGTLLFHLCAKFKVPAFLGSSFAFLSGFAAVANLNTGKYASMSVNDKAAYACGGIVVAGLLYLIFALIIRMVGVKRVMRYLPPVVTGPVIICIGLSLAGSAGSHHHFQHLGKRNVQNHSDSDGRCDCLRCGSCPECTRHQKSGRIRDHQLCVGCTGRHRRTSAAAALQIRSDQHYDHGTDRDRDHDGACRRSLQP